METILESGAARVDLGQIDEFSGEVTGTLRLRAGPSESVVVDGIDATCGCTTASGEALPIRLGPGGLSEPLAYRWNIRGRSGPGNVRITLSDSTAGASWSADLHAEVRPAISVRPEWGAVGLRKWLAGEVVAVGIATRPAVPSNPPDCRIDPPWDRWIDVVAPTISPVDGVGTISLSLRARAPVENLPPYFVLRVQDRSGHSAKSRWAVKP